MPCKLMNDLRTEGTLKATKFGKPFMEKIVTWEKTLSAISETLEVSQTVQKQWMYLENICKSEIWNSQTALS